MVNRKFKVTNFEVYKGVIPFRIDKKINECHIKETEGVNGGKENMYQKLLGFRNTSMNDKLVR